MRCLHAMHAPRASTLAPLVLAALAVPAIAVASMPQRVAGPSVSHRAVAPLKPTVPPADYGKWERLGRGSLSPRGDWLAAPIVRVDGNRVLRLHRVGSDSVVVIENGHGAVFARDGHWVAYAIGVPESTRERMQKAHEPIRESAGIFDFTRGDTALVPDVASFAFSGDGRYLALERYPATTANGSAAGNGPARGTRGRQHADATGADLLVRDLTTGRDTHFGAVASFSWSDRGARLAFTTAGRHGAGASVELYEPATTTLRTLASGAPSYAGLAWRRKQADLAVLAAVADSGFTDTTHIVLAWRDVDRAGGQALRFDPGRASGFPAGFAIVDSRTPRWSDDGQRIFFGIRSRTPAPPAPKKHEGAGAGGHAQEHRAAVGVAADTSKPGLEIWNARDVDIVPQQKVRARRDREWSDLAAWTIEGNHLARITDGREERAVLDAHGSTVVVLDGKPYMRERMFGPNLDDVYVVDPVTGTRTKVASHVQYFEGVSPGGRYVLWVDSADYWSFDVRSGRRVDLTKGLGLSFVNNLDDHPIVEKPPYGTGGWMQRDRAVLLYDHYDVWSVRPDGSGAHRLTDGAADSVRYRVVKLDAEADAFNPARPLYLSMYGEWTKRYGYARMVGGHLHRLVWLDKNVAGLIKARRAGVYAYVVQDYDDSPDYFVGGPGLGNAGQVTHTNPFQKDYAWGHSQLIDYHNREGRRLQAALFYPANYDPSRKYPMITYIYEIRSPSVHQYMPPSERNYYDWTVFNQEGYFVLQPDIVYPRARNPGLSAVDAIVPAVKAVLATGKVDPKRVGLVGHSWGGYQTAFTVTQTNIFAAAVAGAPLTDLFSMYLSIYWNSGGTDARIFEISQGRMAVPFWKDLSDYRANSPVFHIENLNTPLLVEDGTHDGAVDFNQAVELYNAARRARKNLVLLVYLGQNHGLSNKADQMDYHRRILEWFNHYLKGAPAREWMTKGLPYRVQEKRFRTTPAGSPRTGDGR